MSMTREELMMLEALGVGGAYPEATALAPPQGLLGKAAGGIAGALSKDPNAQRASARASNLKIQAHNWLAQKGVPGFAEKPLIPEPPSATTSIFDQPVATQVGSAASAQAQAQQGAGGATRTRVRQEVPVERERQQTVIPEVLAGKFPEAPTLDMPMIGGDPIQGPGPAPEVSPGNFSAAIEALDAGAPQAPVGPGKMEKLAALLGGAAGGAAMGLQSPFTASVVAGAGAGAQQAVAKLNQEMRERTQQFQTQNQIYLRTNAGILAQQALAGQQASTASAQLESTREGQRITAESAEAQINSAQAAMEAQRGFQQAQMQLSVDLAKYEATKPQAIMGKNGLQVMYRDEEGNLIFTDTHDSVFSKMLLEFEALSSMMTAANMPQESILIGFEEIALQGIAQELRPAAILAAAALMSPENSYYGEDEAKTNLVEEAHRRLLSRNPESEMLANVVASGRATQDQNNEYQLRLHKELMGMMMGEGGDRIYKFMLTAYGGAGLPRQLLQMPSIANAVGGMF